MESFDNPFDAMGNFIYNKSMFLSWQFSPFDYREDVDECFFFGSF